MAGVIIGRQGRRRAEADAVKRNAYAAYLNAMKADLQRGRRRTHTPVLPKE